MLICSHNSRKFSDCSGSRPFVWTVSKCFNVAERVCRKAESSWYADDAPPDSFSAMRTLLTSEMAAIISLADHPNDIGAAKCQNIGKTKTPNRIELWMSRRSLEPESCFEQRKCCAREEKEKKRKENRKKKLPHNPHADKAVVACSASLNGSLGQGRRASRACQTRKALSLPNQAVTHRHLDSSPLLTVWWTL